MADKLGSFEFISSEDLDSMPDEEESNSSLDDATVILDRRPGTARNISEHNLADSHLANQRGPVTARRLTIDDQSGAINQSTKN